MNLLLKLRYRPYDIVHLTWYNTRMVRACENHRLVITIHDMVQEIFGTDAVTAERKNFAVRMGSSPFPKARNGIS